MAKSFEAQVSAWAAQSKQRTQAVFRNSAQRIYERVTTPDESGGKLPFLDGNLQKSAAVATDAPVPVKKDVTEFADNTQANELVIAGADLGDTVYVTFQAAHGPRQNYGFVGQDSLGRTYNQAGAHFIEDAAERWQQIVKEESAKVQASVEARKRS